MAIWLTIETCHIPWGYPWQSLQASPIFLAASWHWKSVTIALITHSTDCHIISNSHIIDNLWHWLPHCHWTMALNCHIITVCWTLMATIPCPPPSHVRVSQRGFQCYLEHVFPPLPPPLCASGDSVVSIRPLVASVSLMSAHIQPWKAAWPPHLRCALPWWGLMATLRTVPTNGFTYPWVSKNPYPYPQEPVPLLVGRGLSG